MVKPEVLDAALAVFARYGFRKSSMDQVARAAGISRQGLYLHFATKEALFHATVEHLLAGSLAAARAALAGQAPLVERLVRACDQWSGRYVGAFSAQADDLGEATRALGVAPLIAAYEARFASALAAALRPLAAAYRPAGLTPRQLAATLVAAARGLKHSGTRAQFVAGVRLAARALCAPLAGGARRP